MKAPISCKHTCKRYCVMHNEAVMTTEQQRLLHDEAVTWHTFRNQDG